MNHKRIGIIGGVGPSATILYYRGIIEGYYKIKGDQHFPEVVIHSLDFEEVNGYFKRGELGLLSDKLVRVIEGFQDAGCDFALFACNAMHLVFERVQNRVSLPMLNIIDCVLREVLRQSVKKVGLMGTTFVMESGLYRQPLEQLGIECLQLYEGEQKWIMKVIMGDLQQSRIPHETVARLLKDVQVLKEREAEGVILACTDLPAAITDENSSLPLFDSTKIHVKTILDWSLGTAN